MMNFSLYAWLKQNSLTVGGMLLAIAMTTCSASAKPQATSSAANKAIATSLTSSPASLTQTIASVELPQQKAVQVISDYYSAIARRNYKQAYSAWDRNGAASQQSFEQFKQGFANTKSTTVKIGEPGRIDGAAGSSYIEIPVTITAITKNGTRQRFRGSYVLRRVNNVPGSTPKQRRWHLYSANINQIK